MRSLRPNAVWLLIASAGLLVNLLAWGAGIVGSDQGRITALLTHAPPLVAILPALCILALTVLRRAAWAILIAAVSVLVAIGPLGGLALPRPHAAAAVEFPVMTFNVEKWSHGAPRVAAVLAEYRPAVFCLQEAGDYDYVPDNTAQLRRFASVLHEFRLFQAGELTIGTRLPVVSSNTTPLPIGPASRPLLEVTVLGPSDERITVLNAHLVHTAYFSLSPTGLRDAAQARLAQAEAILARTAAIRGPVVLCGDFNTSPRSAALRRLTSHLSDSWSEGGLGFGMTMSSSWPIRRIDYVLTRDLDVHRVSLPSVSASDHRPVLAVLAPRVAREAARQRRVSSSKGTALNTVTAHAAIDVASTGNGSLSCGIQATDSPSACP